jgi:hypothetical protein
MDVEHLLPFIEALDRANDDTVGVFAPEAGLANHVSHGTSSPRQRMKANYGRDGKVFAPSAKWEHKLNPERWKIHRYILAGIART